LLTDYFTIFNLMSRAETACSTFPTGKLHVTAAHVSIVIFHARMLLNVVVELARLECSPNTSRLLPLYLNAMLIKLRIKLLGLLIWL
jgi:hypothetical protein